MGFNLRRFIRRPTRSLVKIIHNPAASILPKKVRTSSVFRNVARPVVKVASGAVAGFVASGFNPVGAVIGAATSIAAGGALTNNAFRPLGNIVAPLAVAAAVEYAPALITKAGSALGGSGSTAVAAPVTQSGGVVATGSSLASSAGSAFSALKGGVGALSTIAGAAGTVRQVFGKNHGGVIKATTAFVPLAPKAAATAAAKPDYNTGKIVLAGLAIAIGSS